MQVDVSKTVRELAVELPCATGVFEKLGIDYCCGGKRPLEEACELAGVPFEAVTGALAQAHADEARRQESRRDWSAAPLADLIAYICEVHHGYVREESPRLRALLSKVVSKHGANHPELVRVQQVFESLASELAVHMMKEEHILFPFVVRMEEAVLSGEPVPPNMFGTVRNPIQAMVNEHDGAGDLLRQIRQETNDLRVPDDACTSYQTLYRQLTAFEADLHQHIHLENNILFPRALNGDGAVR